MLLGPIWCTRSPSYFPLSEELSRYSPSYLVYFTHLARRTGVPIVMIMWDQLQNRIHLKNTQLLFLVDLFTICITMTYIMQNQCLNVTCWGLPRLFESSIKLLLTIFAIQANPKEFFWNWMRRMGSLHNDRSLLHYSNLQKGEAISFNLIVCLHLNSCYFSE